VEGLGIYELLPDIYHPMNLGLTQFFMMAMLVQLEAFWYGSRLVSDGKNTLVKSCPFFGLA
jgi:hypothetical protein